MPVRSLPAALVAAVTAVAAVAGLSIGVAPAWADSAARTVVIRGTVTGAADATSTTATAALAGVAVGFLADDGTAPAAATTDARGRFALTVPATDVGVVYAGPRPDRTRGVFGVGGAHYVRGVIGATRPAGASDVLAAAADDASAATIAAAGAVAFRLQRAGTIAGADPLLAGRAVAATVLRRDGSVVQTLSADASGAFRSHSLVPGTYDVLLTPHSPYLPATVQRVVATAGATTTVAAPTFVRGATLSGRVTVGGAAAAQLPVTVLASDGSVVVRATTGTDGAYTAGRLPTGVYTVAYGARVTAAGVSVPASTVLPSRRSVGIGTDRADVVKNVSLAAAATISGVAAGLVGGSVAVVAERTDGTVVADTTAGASGRYTLGGLRPGQQLRLVALTGGGAQQRFGTLDVTPTAGAQTVGAIDAGATTPVLLSGPAKGVKAVTVRASAHLVGRAGVAGGRYAIQVVPGRYTVTATAPGRVDAVSTTRVVGATNHVVRVGPRQAGATAVVTTTGTAAVPSTVTLAAAPSGVTAILAPAAKQQTLVLRPGAPGGVYTIVPTSLTPPVADGPWWFTAPTRRITLKAGDTTALGTIVLRVQGG